MKLRVEYCGALVNEAAEHNLVSDMKRDITKFGTVLLRSNWSSLRRKYWSKIPTDMNILICGPKTSNISGIFDAISPRYIRNNPCSMYARVPHMMAQFVLKIEKLSHIIGTAPILEIARAYALRPRLWLLVVLQYFPLVVCGQQPSILTSFLRPQGSSLEKPRKAKKKNKYIFPDVVWATSEHYRSSVVQ